MPSPSTESYHVVWSPISRADLSTDAGWDFQIVPLRSGQRLAATPVGSFVHRIARTDEMLHEEAIRILYPNGVAPAALTTRNRVFSPVAWTDFWKWFSQNGNVTMRADLIERIYRSLNRKFRAMDLEQRMEALALCRRLEEAEYPGLAGSIPQMFAAWCRDPEAVRATKPEAPPVTQKISFPRQRLPEEAPEWKTPTDAALRSLSRLLPQKNDEIAVLGKKLASARRDLRQSVRANRDYKAQIAAQQRTISRLQEDKRELESVNMLVEHVREGLMSEEAAQKIARRWVTKVLGATDSP